MPVNGERQLALIKRIIACDPYYMDTLSFGDALKRAYDEFMRLNANDHPIERANWWSAMTAIHALAQLRFGVREWTEYLKQHPEIYAVTEGTGA